MRYYSLQISMSPTSTPQQVDEILGVKSNNPHCDWELGVEYKENDPPFYFVEYFLSLLEDKYEQLESIGILREDISVWMLYEYDGQCNMEFSPEEMKRLGDNGIVLCISCWEK